MLNLFFSFAMQYFESYSYDFYAISTEAMSQPIFWALLVVVCFLSISVKMVLELLPVVFSLGIHRPKKVAATTREEDIGGDDEEHRYITPSRPLCFLACVALRLSVCVVSGY